MSTDRRLALQPARLLFENLNITSTRETAPITVDHFLIVFDTFGDISNLTVFGQPASLDRRGLLKRANDR